MKIGSLGLAGTALGIKINSPFDTIIRNGTVIDGSGKDSRPVDVGIKGDTITALGDLEGAGADRVIDAAGLVVAPGFIDIHTHTDVELLANPLGESKIRQGVTTEVSGNCGSSPFPLDEDDRTELDKRWRNRFGTNVSWHDLEGFFTRLELSEPSINYATFTGHGSLRGAVVGKNDVPASPEQLAEMKRLLAQTMEVGSLGLATGLEYTPGSYAGTEELIELAKVAAAYDGVYATHMRNEDDTVKDAIQEALRICRRAEVSTQISHLKVANQGNWHKIDSVLELIYKTRETLPVEVDRYPYVAWGTGLTTFLPLESRQGETEQVLERLNDPEHSPRIRTFAESRALRIGGWDKVMISYCASEQGKKYQGKTILSCAEEAGQEPVDFAIGLLLSEKNQVGIVGFAMSEENLEKVLASPFTMIGSDGNAIAPYGKLAAGNPHPRFYGTFPRVLGKYSRDEQIIGLEAAVHKMTGMPAAKLGLADRGILMKKKVADITVFDPKTVIDRATFENPHQYPVGIEYVFVNGKLTIEKGKHTGARRGRILRHKK
ncbi:MAG: D-aminoacylase [Candidatus Neomarinimicrobiota bacterium]